MSVSQKPCECKQIEETIGANGFNNRPTIYLGNAVQFFLANLKQIARPVMTANDSNEPFCF